MLLFLTGTLVWTATLVAAGYSHYRYRVKNDRIYEASLGKEYGGGTW